MRDRPEHSEIEITPGMNEARVAALHWFDGGYMDTHEEAVERIYCAMAGIKEGDRVLGLPVREYTS